MSPSGAADSSVGRALGFCTGVRTGFCTGLVGDFVAGLAGVLGAATAAGGVASGAAVVVASVTGMRTVRGARGAWLRAMDGMLVVFRVTASAVCASVKAAG